MDDGGPRSLCCLQISCLVRRTQSYRWNIKSSNCWWRTHRNLSRLSFFEESPKFDRKRKNIENGENFHHICTGSLLLPAGSGAADPDSVLTSRARRREQKSFHISKVTDADSAGRFHRMRRRLRLQVELQELEDPLELYRMESGPNRSGHSHDWPFFTNRTSRSIRKPWRLVLTWFWVLEYSPDGPRKRQITCLGRPTPPPRPSTQTRNRQW